MDELNNINNNILEFKSLSINDVNQIHEFSSNKDASKYIGWNLKTTLEDTEKLINTLLKNEANKTHIYASVYLKNTDILIGTAMIFNIDKTAKHAEIGYVLHQDFWHNGYGTEMISMLSDFCFNILKINKIYANVVEPNIGSQCILIKNNFTLEAELKEHFYIDNQYHSCLIFSKKA